MGGATALVVGSQVKPPWTEMVSLRMRSPGRDHGESESIPPRTHDKSKSYSQSIAVSSEVHKMRAREDQLQCALVNSTCNRLIADSSSAHPVTTPEPSAARLISSFGLPSFGQPVFGLGRWCRLYSFGVMTKIYC